MKIQDYATGKRVVVHFANGEDPRAITVAAADLIGVLAEIDGVMTITPWAALDRIEVSA